MLVLENIKFQLSPLLRGYFSKVFGGRYSVADLKKPFIYPKNSIVVEIDSKDIGTQGELPKEFQNAIRTLNKSKPEIVKQKPVFVDVANFASYKVSSTAGFSLDTENELNPDIKGKIVFIAGAAQGIGAALAKILIKRGCLLIIGDINVTKVKEYARALCDEFGKGRALGIKIDVTSEKSIQEALNNIVRYSGGIDVLISNVGIVKPGAVEEYELDDFVKMTMVNYVAYFLLVKHFTPLLRLQNRAHGNYVTDIIQINSKSGIEGSAKNSAYAGSKFGGIGLTRSFAHELIPDNIKVNAICPGNYYDGDLWSNPERGLFVQFLQVGRVPGAKTVGDVRKYYEGKAPIKRGVSVEDIARAVIYVIEQQYETGQAVPVAGGQIMLH